MATSAENFNCEMTTAGIDGRRGSRSISKSIIDSSGIPEQLTRLTKQVVMLEKRLLNVEKMLKSSVIRDSLPRSSIQLFKLTQLGKLSEKTDSQESTRVSGLRGAGKTALATVNHTLITSKPYNADYLSYVCNFFVVLRRNPFAIFQCLLMLLMIVALLLFGVIKFRDAQDSTMDQYKPLKVDGRDEYYNNEELTYQIPLHYFMFEMVVNQASFHEAYRETYNENCTSRDETCLTAYLENFLNIDYFAPTGMPSDFAPEIDDTVDRYLSRTKQDFESNPVYAYCNMRSSNNGSIELITTYLRNFTFFVENIGIDTYYREQSNETIEVFGVLLKMEFNDFDDYKEGWFKCDLYIEMDQFDKNLSSFANFDIFFMVSRTDYTSAEAGTTSYLRSRKKLWHDTDGVVEKVYNYVYEESTFDGASDFSAEVFLETNELTKAALLNIMTYAYPTVLHWVSFERYSYTDWLADVGGFYTLVITLFFILSTRVTYWANRKDAFQRRHGILPALSMAYRNAEELSGLRYLVLAALGISEEAYFQDDFQKFLSVRI